jgi:uncharacterized caspase-like protein
MSKKALVIGINSYPSSPLAGCINDANSISALLEHNEDGSPNFNVRKVLDVRCHSEIKKSVKELFSGDDDIALLYYSGHGFSNELGGYIVAPDFTDCGEGLSMSDVLALANQSGCRNKVIILDCCHAGAMGNYPAITANNNCIIGSGMTVLTASGEHESAMEIDGHGAFTSLLISALQGGAADLKGEVSPGGIYAYVDKALAEWDQRPMFKTNVNSFVSLRSTEPLIPLKTIRRITEYFPYRDEEFKLDPS